MNATLDFVSKTTKEADVVPMATRQIRFPDDLAHKLSVIASISNESIAVVCDRLFRDIVEAEQRSAVDKLANTIRKTK